MDDSTPLSIHDAVTLLRASADAAALEVRALGPRAAARPAEGEWCANEVLGHLIEADRRGFAGRIRQIVEEDRPAFQRWDQPAVAAARRDHEREGAALADELLAARESDLAYLAGLADASLDRVGIHPRVGEISARDVLHEWVHHDREHLAQILAVTQALAWPWMGNTQLFSKPRE